MHPASDHRDARDADIKRAKRNSGAEQDEGRHRMCPNSGSEAVGDGSSPTCLLCGTADVTITTETLRRSASWRRTVCRQMWSATRLEAVASYARYVATS